MANPSPAPAQVGVMFHRLDASRRRLAWLATAALLSLAVIWGRTTVLILVEGGDWRAEALRPIRNQREVWGRRGRILSRDGTVLATDVPVSGLAMHYRCMEDPPDDLWLARQARRRLPASQRRDPAAVAESKAGLLREIHDLRRRLALLAGMSEDEWRSKSRQIQVRVEAIAQAVNRRRGSDQSPIVVTEELDYHVIADNVGLEVVAAVEGHPDLYPWARIVAGNQRVYPQAPLAASVLGTLAHTVTHEGGRAGPAGRPGGISGLERQYDSILAGRSGTVMEVADRLGDQLERFVHIQPADGRDLVLALDSRLESVCEELLASALERRLPSEEGAGLARGAVVVMNVRNGALFAVASAARREPGTAIDASPSAGDTAGNPAVEMALPPGSVFKLASAVALVESGTIAPQVPVYCNGYLHEPTRWRCQTFVQTGVGHGPIRLGHALSESCNVYFFRLAEQLGPEPLVEWSRQLGFGTRTGVDLPGESAGQVPSPATIVEIESHAWRKGDTRLLAIGQGSLLVTPLQVAAMTSAIANGGFRVTPRVAVEVSLEGEIASPAAEAPFVTWPPPARIADLNSGTLRAIRDGMEMAILDPSGTAHGTMRHGRIPMAGKTGSAQTIEPFEDHAWFAGYAPADAPVAAVVVVLERAGGGAEMAGPVARRVVDAMADFGYFRHAERQARR
jgi:penicillin-binding protein 2